MGKELNKKDWICTQPFNFSEIYDHAMYMCCPQWLPENIGKPDNTLKNWYSKKAEKIRESIVDGSYRFCNENRCPKLIGLKEGRSNGFITRNKFLNRADEYFSSTIKSVKFNFDQSCNLQCPSCRTEKINYEGNKRDKAELLIKKIEEQISRGLEEIVTSGSGDPFFSRTFRKWLMNFDKTKYPNLKRIHLHTNGTLWNKSNWERMKNIHPYVKSCEISIDAATKNTYENKTRLGGKWEEIIENLYYISTIKHLKTVTLSFVVQHSNYKEMNDFYKLCESIFSNTGKRFFVFFNRISNWGTYNQDIFKQVDISNPQHPEYLKFLNEYNKLPLGRITHNLHITKPIINA